MSEDHLKGKLVTVVYEITDPKEWRKTNPLHYEHHGMRAVGVSASDLMEENERLEKGLRIIANFERDKEGFATDEQIARHYLEQPTGRAVMPPEYAQPTR